MRLIKGINSKHRSLSSQRFWRDCLTNQAKNTAVKEGYVSMVKFPSCTLIGVSTVCVRCIVTNNV